MAVTPVFFIFIILLIVPFFLQVYLSKRESKYLGLVLPIMSFLFSVMIVLGSLMYTGDPLSVLIPMLLYNIPTVIHITIYFACREKFSKKKQMDKMNVIDL